MAGIARVLTVAALAVLLSAGQLPAPSAFGQQADEGVDRTDRLAGTDRYLTAVAISQHAFPEGAGTVHLARSDVHVDAVSGGVLTAGPILLVPTHRPVPQAVLDEVERLGATTVVALGGPNAVGDDVLAEVATAGDGPTRTTRRLAGTNRWGTAAAITRSMHPNGADNVVLAPTDAEALAAGNTGWPVLPVPATRDTIPAEIRAELVRLNPTEIWLTANDGALYSIITKMPGWPQGPPVVSWFDGPDSATLAGQAALIGFGHVEVDVAYLARQDVLADAVAGSILRDGPILFTDRCSLPLDTEHVSDILDPAQVVALGGPNAVCDEALEQLGTHARAPFAGPTTRDVRTFDSSTSRSAWPLAWSGDGNHLLVSNGWPVGSSSGHEVVDARTGTSTPLPWDERWEFHPEFAYTGQAGIVLSSNGKRAWAGVSGLGQDNGGTSGVLELRTDGTTALVAEGFPSAMRGSTFVLLRREPGEPEASAASYRLHVTNLETGTSWSIDHEQGPYGQPEAPLVVRVAPDGSWVIVAPYDNDRFSPYERLDVVTPDGTWTPLLEAGPTTECVEHLVHLHGVSDDLRRVLWQESTFVRSEAPVECFDDSITFTQTSWLTDRVANVTVALVDVPDGGYVDSASVTGDGRHAVLSVSAPFEESGAGSAFLAGRDGPRFEDGPGVDGDRQSLFIVDLDKRLADGTVDARLVPWLPGWPEQEFALVGPTVQQVAWLARPTFRSASRLHHLAVPSGA